MALTAEEVDKILLMLKLPATDGAEIFYRPQEKVMVRARVAREQLVALTSHKETRARSLLTQFAVVEFDTDTLKAQGLDSNPARTRAILRSDMELLLGLPPSGGGGLKIQRG